MKKKPKRKKTQNLSLKKKILKWIIDLVALLTVFFLILFFAVFIGVFGKIPSVNEVKNIQNYLASEIYSADNQLLGRYYIQNRTNVAYNRIPVHFINALIATEDARFYEHNGIDRRSVFRVIFKSILLHNESSGGGSTITQQLAKNLYSRKNVWILSMPVNKFREMIIARRLEKALSKKDILQLYINTVSFGENTYGIETAARRFFNKSPSQLKVEESAMLVGMLKGTNIYNPKINYDKAVQRRNVVLGQMVKYNYLKAAIADSLKKLPVRLDYVKYTHNEGPAPYFREYLRQELLKWVKSYNDQNDTDYNIYTDGLKIYTSINSDLQQYAEQAVREHLSRLQSILEQQWKNREPWSRNSSMVQSAIQRSERYRQLKQSGKGVEEIKKAFDTPVSMEVFSWKGTKEENMSPLDSIGYYMKFLQAGFLAMEAKTGYIRAWVGGIDFKYFQYDHVIARRQTGSVFKPVVYAAALQSGTDPCEYIPNDSVTFPGFDNWTPRNADLSYGGYYSMKGGLTHSVNTVSVHLLMETGIDKVIDLARNMGIEGDLPEVPSLALGTGECSLMDMVKAYSVFINNGNLVMPIYLKRIEDKTGKVLYQVSPAVERGGIITEETAQTMVNMMENVVNQGTASTLRTIYGFTNDIAGKTGTTQSYTDGWYIGYTPDLVAGVWVGGDNPAIRFRSMGYGQGAFTALPVWARFMQKVYRNPLYRNAKNSVFNIPESIAERTGCPDFSEEPHEGFWNILERKHESVIDIIKRIFHRKNKKKDKNQDNEEQDFDN